MAKPSPITRLSDADALNFRHMCRRRETTDLELAQWVEDRLGKLWASDHARAMAVNRFRRSREFTEWRERWEKAQLDLEKSVTLERERLSVLGRLAGAGEGLEGGATLLQGRLLMAAQRLTDQDLMEAMQGRGWLKNLLDIAASQRLRKAQEKAVAVAEDTQLSGEERAARIREIFAVPVEK